MSNVFFALYLIDFEENSFQEIFSPNGVYLTYGKKDNAKDRLKALVDTWVSEEYKSAMRIFTDAGTIDERLGDKPIITQEYTDINGNWVRCCFFPVEKNEIGKNVRVICGLRRITAEKEIQESQNNLIQALSLTYENVYAVNMDTAEAVCYRMGKTMISRYGQKFAVGDYERSIHLYVENDVLEDDRHLFDKICLIQDVKILLADKQTYSFNYRVSRNNTVQYFECQLVKPDSKRNEFAIGFKNVNEEKKQELEHQKKIEDALAEVEKLNETLQDEMDIAGALSKDYPNVVLLDFADDTAVTIKLNGTIIKDDERVIRRSYNGLWDSFILKYISEEDRANLKAAVSSEAVLNALETKDEYNCSYKTVYDNTGVHYYQASFIRICSRRTAENQIILGFRNIDAIVE